MSIVILNSKRGRTDNKIVPRIMNSSDLPTWRNRWPHHIRESVKSWVLIGSRRQWRVSTRAHKRNLAHFMFVYVSCTKRSIHDRKATNSAAKLRSIELKSFQRLFNSLCFDSMRALSICFVTFLFRSQARNAYLSLNCCNQRFFRSYSYNYQVIR